MVFGGHYLQQFCLGKFGFDLKKHLEVIVIGIVIVTTAPVLYKLFFGQRNSLPAAAKEDPYKKS
jgi:membrane-associated protein